MRGAIAIRLDTTAEATERARLSQQTYVFAGLTIFLVVILLYTGLRATVLKPVGTIEAVTARIGGGDLDVQVDLKSRDEIGRLATHINEMTRGLRQKIELSKFVSQATVERVQEADGAVDREGERRELSILFSDIRGFTAYSEAHEPEAVVRMLNAYLQAQADQVLVHGGDIDKYVGDELMARFDGKEHARRATECALEMVRAVHELNAAEVDDVAIEIGIGVNSGEVVLGAMGSRERMDFTVIGDAVNLAARIAGQAKAGQIITSGETMRQLDVAHRAKTRFVISTSVKGKQKPVELYELTWESDTELTLVGIQPLDLGSLTQADQRCDVVFDGQTHCVTPEHDMMTLGRGLQNTLVVSHRKASRVHARIEHRRGRFFLLDQSTNGTYIVTSDGQRTRVHREEFALSQTGAIGLGEELDFDARDAVRYTCVG